MNYDDWLSSIPQEMSGDQLWHVEAYRLALFAGECVKITPNTA